MNGIPVFRVKSLVAQPVRAWKRSMDMGLVLIFGIIALPVVVAAALAIKLESPGAPVYPLKDLHILFHTLKVMLMRDKAS